MNRAADLSPPKLGTRSVFRLGALLFVPVSAVSGLVVVVVVVVPDAVSNKKGVSIEKGVP